MAFWWIMMLGAHITMPIKKECQFSKVVSGGAAYYPATIQSPLVVTCRSSLSPISLHSSNGLHHSQLIKIRSGVWRIWDNLNVFDCQVVLVLFLPIITRCVFEQEAVLILKVSSTRMKAEFLLETLLRKYCQGVDSSSLLLIRECLLHFKGYCTEMGM